MKAQLLNPSIDQARRDWTSKVTIHDMETKQRTPETRVPMRAFPAQLGTPQSMQTAESPSSPALLHKSPGNLVGRKGSSRTLAMLYLRRKGFGEVENLLAVPKPSP